MTSQPPDDDVTRLWQAQTDGGPVMVTDIRARAARFESGIRWRNLLEYGAAVVVVAGYTRMLWTSPSVLAGVGAVLILLATLHVVYRIYARGSVSRMPGDMALTTCLDFHRAQLLRQRDLLRSVWTWYLLPFVPGLLVLLIGRTAADPGRAPRVAITGIVCVMVFLAIGWLNERAARRLDREIEALDSAR